MSDKKVPMLQVAAKAIIVNPEGKVLIMREAGESYEEGTNAGLYHGAAGGRINPEEAFPDALKREVEEETGITDFEPLYPVHVGEWWPVIKEVKRHIVAIFVVCKTSIQDVQLSDEHDEYHWVTIEELDNFNLLAPDRAAIHAYIASRT